MCSLARGWEAGGNVLCRHHSPSCVPWARSSFSTRRGLNLVTCTVCVGVRAFIEITVCTQVPRLFTSRILLPCKCNVQCLRSRSAENVEVALVHGAPHEPHRSPTAVAALRRVRAVPPPPVPSASSSPADRSAVVRMPQPNVPPPSPLYDCCFIARRGQSRGKKKTRQYCVVSHANKVIKSRGRVSFLLIVLC